MAQGAVPFATLGTQTGTSTASTVSSLESNAASWVAGDLLILVTTWSRDAARTVGSVGSTAGTPPTFSAVEYVEGTAGGGNTCGIDVRSSIAPSAETSKTCTPTMTASATVFNLAVSLIVIPGGGVVRQSDSAGNGTGADIDITLASAVIGNSLMIAAGARRDAAGWTSPTNYALVSQPPTTTSQNQRVLERGSFSSGGNGGAGPVTFAGFGANPCVAALLEITR